MKGGFVVVEGGYYFGYPVLPFVEGEGWIRWIGHLQGPEPSKWKNLENQTECQQNRHNGKNFFKNRQNAKNFFLIKCQKIYIMPKNSGKLIVKNSKKNFFQNLTSTLSKD